MMKFLQDLTVNVMVEVLEQYRFEVADIITIHVGGCELYSSTSTYMGIHGIASIKLAYSITTTTEEFMRDCIKNSKQLLFNYFPLQKVHTVLYNIMFCFVSM